MTMTTNDTADLAARCVILRSQGKTLREIADLEGVTAKEVSVALGGKASNETPRRFEHDGIDVTITATPHREPQTTAPPKPRKTEVVTRRHDEQTVALCELLACKPDGIIDAVALLTSLLADAQEREEQLREDLADRDKTIAALRTKLAAAQTTAPPQAPAHDTLGLMAEQVQALATRIKDLTDEAQQQAAAMLAICYDGDAQDALGWSPWMSVPQAAQELDMHQRTLRDRFEHGALVDGTLIEAERPEGKHWRCRYKRANP